MEKMKEKTRKEKIWQSQERSGKLSMDMTALLAYLIAIVLFPAAALMRSFRNLRIGLLHYRAMGRFYGNTEYFLRERKFHPPKEKDAVFLISGSVPVNKQILAMVGRQVPVIRSDRLWNVLDYLRKVTPDNSLWIDLGNTGWLRGAEWTVPGPQLSFTQEEHVRGKELLRRLGIPEGSRHVCFFAKDRLYTDSPDTKLDPESYWGSRDFRNCDIKNYLPAAQYLAEQGMYVFRMGIHQPEERLPVGLDPHIVDYTGAIRPTLEDPDFADAYIQATCKFFLGTTSGIYVLSSMFGIPVAYANMVPYGECGRMPHDIVIFKKCRNRGTGQFIPLPELIARGLDADWLTLDELEQLDREGIEFVENTGEEILDLAREMNMRLDGMWEPNPEDEELQLRYVALSPARCFDGSGFPGRVGASFLREERHLL
jgi:putative glycosyltransferase (TIGR04372 family)